MKDLSVEVNGLKFENPFVVGSGPPGTNKATINRAFKEGWGGMVVKTISLDTPIQNVSPRYGKLHARGSGEVIGFQNIELISDRSFDDWLSDLEAIKKEWPEKMLIASIMESYNKDSWQNITKRIQETGVDAFELNFSCPHGMPEKKMGMAMGENPEMVGEVTKWVTEVSEVPVWAKMTPNLTDISIPSMQAVKAGADGIALINTILSVIGINLDTFAPKPTVKGYSIPGGYSGRAVKPIALRHVLTLAQALRDSNNSHITMSGMGGVECAEDAIEFILMGSNTVQSCTGPMTQGFKMVKELCQGLSSFMEKHGFNSVEEFRGKSLDLFTTHKHLVDLKSGKFESNEVSKDTQWSGENISNQTDDMTSD